MCSAMSIARLIRHFPALLFAEIVCNRSHDVGIRTDLERRRTGSACKVVMYHS